MSRRLDFNQDLRNRQARHGLNVKDEAEWMENDTAARWFEKTRSMLRRKPTIVHHASFGMKITSLKHKTCRP